MARELQKAKQTGDQQVTHEQISQRAYEIFVERGCPEGRDLEHWLEAEAQLNGETQNHHLPPKREKTSTRHTISRRT